jgi:hypothetical protein
LIPLTNLPSHLFPKSTPSSSCSRRKSFRTTPKIPIKEASWAGSSVQPSRISALNPLRWPQSTPHSSSPILPLRLSSKTNSKFMAGTSLQCLKITDWTNHSRNQWQTRRMIWIESRARRTLTLRSDWEGTRLWRPLTIREQGPSLKAAMGDWVRCW